jgi:tetratricopeptide (TPR) repeat protein
LDLNSQDKYDEANAAFAEASCNKGIALHGQGKYYKTIDAYDEAINLNPTKNHMMHSSSIIRHQSNKFIYSNFNISTRNVYNRE